LRELKWLLLKLCLPGLRRKNITKEKKVEPITEEKKVQAEPSIIQTLTKEKKVQPITKEKKVQPITKEKKEIRKKQIKELKKPYKSFFQCQYDPFVDMPCKKLVCNPGDKYCKEHLNPKCIQVLLTGKACN